MRIEEGNGGLSQSRGLVEEELAMKTCTDLLVFPLPLPFMDVEVLRRLFRALLRPVRDVGLHDMQQVKVTLIKSRSYCINHEAVRWNKENNAVAASVGAGVCRGPKNVCGARDMP